MWAHMSFSLYKMIVALLCDGNSQGTQPAAHHAIAEPSILTKMVAGMI